MLAIFPPDRDAIESEVMAKILIIEADSNLSMAIVTILEMAGYDIVTAADGSVGVQAAREQKPDLILCDTLVPYQDGYSVLSTLRNEAATATTPVILLAAHLAQGDTERGKRLGASGFLLKPFTVNELLRIVEYTLRPSPVL
jgi:DNA-binding response OmpR family regulator